MRVNGVIVTELGVKADPETDRIEAAGKLARIPEERVYLLLHKPPGNCFRRWPIPRAAAHCAICWWAFPSAYSRGRRLDYAASGVVFLTNDGDLAARMLKAVLIFRKLSGSR